MDVGLGMGWSWNLGAQASTFGTTPGFDGQEGPPQKPLQGPRFGEKQVLREHFILLSTAPPSTPPPPRGPFYL